VRIPLTLSPDQPTAQNLRDPCDNPGRPKAGEDSRPRKQKAIFGRPLSGLTRDSIKVLGRAADEVGVSEAAGSQKSPAGKRWTPN
jgi:hypothetical protein